MIDDTSVALLQNEVDELENLNAKLNKEKEELVLGVSAKEKQVALLEKEIKKLTNELQHWKIQKSEETLNGEGEIVTDNDHDESNGYIEALRKAREREAQLQVLLLRRFSVYQ